MMEKDPQLAIGEVPYIPPKMTRIPQYREDGSLGRYLIVETKQPDLTGIVCPDEQVAGQQYWDWQKPEISEIQ